MNYIIENIKQRIKEHESCRLIAYKDTRGILTIGWGHRVLSSDGIRENETINQKQANDFFEHDFQWITSGVRQLVPLLDDLPEPVQIVLFDMAFNNGVLGLARFKKFLHYVNLGLFPEAADEIVDSDNYRSHDLHGRYSELEQMVRNSAI